MTAISMADGYARVTGRPQAVIVHVDVGTQALAHGVHNASIGRAPVLIFSGLSPFTESGELTGSRTEYMHWLQDAPDQKAIVRQFCRYVGEIRSGVNVKHSVSRALQFAASDPKGPVYLASAREVLAEKVMPYSLVQEQCGPIESGALPADAIDNIAWELVHADRPMVITGYSGRNKKCPEELVKLADAIPGLRVLDCGGSDMCFPLTHRASEGFRLATHECTKDADVILVIDCDVPWIPSLNPPSKDAKIYHIDVDPLNYMMPVSFFPANGRWKADSHTALTQLNHSIQSSLLSQELTHSKFRERWDDLGKEHEARMAEISKLPGLGSSDSLTAHNIGALLKRHLPPDTVYIIEAVTCAQALSDQLSPEIPGTWINAGGTGIGWSNGAAVGAKLGLDSVDGAKGSGDKKPSFVCQVVGDGSYMCGSPASAAWVAAKYNIPILTVLLNNGGEFFFFPSFLLPSVMQDVFLLLLDSYN
jgi:thiamine pyrophosphate-dependent acetolactate synthase large subunit-like protein